MTPFCFLHAADIHLDSPLIELSDVEGWVAERIRTARYHHHLIADRGFGEWRVLYLGSIVLELRL